MNKLDTRTVYGILTFQIFIYILRRKRNLNKTVCMYYMEKHNQPQQYILVKYY